MLPSRRQMLSLQLTLATVNVVLVLGLSRLACGRVPGVPVWLSFGRVFFVCMFLCSCVNFEAYLI